MSDNLKVAKECGATVLEDGCVIFHHEIHLDDYTSHILASQQAAHDAEIARLNGEVQSLRDYHSILDNDEIKQLYRALSTSNERIAYLEGLVALQADALKETTETYKRVFGSSSVTADKAISATAETVQAFRDKLTEPLLAQVAMLINVCSRLSRKLESLPETYAIESEWLELSAALENTQATAQAYEQEVEARGAVKALGKVIKFGAVGREARLVFANLQDRDNFLELVVGATSKKAG